MNSATKKESPRDIYNVVYISFFFMGLLQLLPGFFFVTATGYWMHKFRDISSDDLNSKNRTDIQALYTYIFNVTLLISNVVFSYLAMFFARRFNIKARIIVCLVTVLSLFAITAVFVQINTDSWQTGFLSFTSLIIAAISGTISVFSITMFTIISHFPKDYLAAYLNGGGLAKLVSATLQILSLTLNLSVEDDALAYFCSGIFFIALTMLLYILASNSEFYFYYMKNSGKEVTEETLHLKDVFEMMKKIWPSFVIGAFYMAQISWSPIALVVSVNEKSSDWNQYYFIPTISYFLESLCVLVGKMLTSKLKLNFSDLTWMLISFFYMLIFVPLIMFCNAQPRHHLPVIFDEDYQYIIIIIASGLINGYISNMMFFVITKSIKEEELKKAYHVFLSFYGIIMVLVAALGVVSIELL